MEEERSAASKAALAAHSAQREEMLAKMGRLAGEVSALEIALNSFMRIARPGDRAAVAMKIRKILDEPSGPPSPFDDAFVSTATNLLARLDAP